jgi:thiol-disulfide isomerase/thioredoxin
MSGHPDKASGGILKWALLGAGAVGLAGLIYIIGQSGTKPAEPQPPAPAAQTADASGFAAKVSTANAGKPPSDYAFVDAAGQPTKLSAFKGQVTVVNLWATWCAPCKLEMPTLAALQKAYDGKPVSVVAISVDLPDKAQAARNFIAQNAPLKFYNDPTAKFPWEMQPTAAGLPTTIIYGKDGLERARIGGDADWSSAGPKALIDKILAEG